MKNTSNIDLCLLNDFLQSKPCTKQRSISQTILFSSGVQYEVYDCVKRGEQKIVDPSFCSDKAYPEYKHRRCQKLECETVTYR